MAQNSTKKGEIKFYPPIVAARTEREWKDDQRIKQEQNEKNTKRTE